MARIAIIEDDVPIREMYALKLRSEGFEVKEAADGKEGLKLIEGFKPDLVLLDLLMPIMDGTSMLRKLRGYGWAKHMIVLVLTNVSKEEAPMELRLLDVKKYLIKAHHTPQQVVDIVSQTLRHYK